MADFKVLKESRIFDLTKQTKRNTNGISLIILTFLFAFVGQTAGGIVGILFQLRLNLLDDPMVSMVVNLVFSCSALIILVFLWVKYVEKRRFSTLGFEKTGLLKKYCRGFLVGVGIIAINVGLMYVTGLCEYLPNVSGGLYAISGVLIMLIGWIIQGASEEILTRGWLMPMLGKSYRAPVAILVSSLIFATLHLSNEHICVLAVVNLILFGIFAALFAIWEGGLWGICAFHSAWNWSQGNIFGYEVSGTVPEGGIVIKMAIVEGYDLWTGGTFGFEGGLLCTATFLIGIVFLFIGIQRDKAYS